MSALTGQKEKKSTIQPNLEWYAVISAANMLSPRCHFASAHRCLPATFYQK